MKKQNNRSRSRIAGVAGTARVERTAEGERTARGEQAAVGEWTARSQQAAEGEQTASAKERTDSCIRRLFIMLVITGAVLFMTALFLPGRGVIFFAFYILLSLLGTGITFRRIKESVNDTISKVDDTIQGLIDGQQKQHFSPNEDTLLGKFQTQIMKLYDILGAHKRQETEFRLQIGSAVSNLVHQINTPITNIELYCGFLDDVDLDAAERRKFIDSICSQAQKLSFLGEGFSKISRMETGIISLNPQVQPILPVLLSAIDEVSPLADSHRAGESSGEESTQEKEGSLAGNEIVLRGNQKLKGKLDQKWTGEVFYNLLDNAVKYSTPGTEILVEMIEYELFVRIDFVNEGIRIRPEEYPKIFQRFYRSEEVKDMQGVGLGLYLVREILNGQGGFIKVGSDQDGRTVFSVYLQKETESVSI